MSNTAVLCFILPFVVICCRSPSSEKKTEAGTSGNVQDTENGTVASAAQQMSGRYGIKSGIIHKKLTNSMMKGDNTMVTYFDDYGAVEVTETMTKMEIMGQKVEESKWSSLRDGYLYSYKIGEKTGVKFKITPNFDPKNADWSKMTDELMKQYGIEKDGTEEFLGKTCEVYTMNNTQMNAMGRYLLWKNIVMKTETTMTGISVTEEVTKLEENATIPASKFELPKDVEFREMQMPGK